MYGGGREGEVHGRREEGGGIGSGGVSQSSRPN